ncbi:LpxL/LpxP family acyltransferase, partial [Thiolapillus sp.]
MANRFKGVPLYHPRLWPTWLGVGLLRLLAFLPYGMILRLGPWLGRLYARVLPKRRIIAKTNIDLCFPERSPQWREQLLRDSFDSLGITLLEAPLAWWVPPQRLVRLVHPPRLEKPQQDPVPGKGVLL